MRDATWELGKPCFCLVILVELISASWSMYPPLNEEQRSLWNEVRLMTVGVMKFSLHGVQLSPSSSSLGADLLFFNPYKFGFFQTVGQ